MTARDVRTTKEKRLFNIVFGISALAWIALVVSIIGIAYGILIGLFLFTAHAMLIAYIKGHAIRLSANQFPGIYTRAKEAAQKLGLSKTPEVYIMQAGGALNAFATKLTGRNFIVIYSDLLEACGEEGKELDMIIGHEIGHLALGHLKWLWFLMPARVVPLLGAAYSRACEYSCDLCGFVMTGDLQSSARGLAVLAAGGKYGKAANMNCFVDQADESGSFWPSVYELNATHPYLPKRIAALENYQSPGSVRIFTRNVLAYPLAPLLGIATPGGSAPLVMVAMIGIIAAIAIPQFAHYRQKADKAALDSAAIEIQAAAHSYYEKTGSWPCSDVDLNAPNAKQLISQKNWKIETNCNDKAVFVTYKENGKDCFRRINFVDGEGTGGDKK
jgi:Zn-dependent protease with chaperone function/Tfp pilus assembly major pilin PilA